MTTLADRIRDGATGYSADMAKAMGWVHNGEFTAWLSPDGTRHASCPDYENNPRHAFDECVRMGWALAINATNEAGVRVGVRDVIGTFYVKRTDTDITRAINEALCRAKGV